MKSPADFRTATRRLMEDAGMPPTLRCGRRHAGRTVLIVRKARLVKSFLSTYVGKDERPDLVELWGLPEKRQIQQLRDWIGPEPGDVRFVGDLSPSVLAVWIAVMRDARALGLNITWHGISDRWIFDALLEKLPKVSLELRPGDQLLWTDLRSIMDVDMPELLGPISTSLLDGGHKLELEAPTNPNLFTADFRQRLFERTGLVTPRNGQKWPSP